MILFKPHSFIHLFSAYLDIILFIMLLVAHIYQYYISVHFYSVLRWHLCVTNKVDTIFVLSKLISTLQSSVFASATRVYFLELVYMQWTYNIYYAILLYCTYIQKLRKSVWFFETTRFDVCRGRGWRQCFQKHHIPEIIVTTPSKKICLFTLLKFMTLKTQKTHSRV